MLKQKSRMIAAVYVLVDVAATGLAWLLAYLLRFPSELVLGFLPVTKGVPPLEPYLWLLPLISLLWPALLYFHGLYQLRRGRSRIDEFFGILFSVLLASALTLGVTLYARQYYFYQPEVAPLWEYSRGVFGLFIVLDVTLLNLGRWALRSHLHRMWRAGLNVQRVAIAGAGELGQTVAETILAHKELGFRVVGFLADAPSPPQVAGLPVLGGLEDATQLLQSNSVDQLYIALPL